MDGACFFLLRIAASSSLLDHLAASASELCDVIVRMNTKIYTGGGNRILHALNGPYFCSKRKGRKAGTKPR